MNPRRHTAWPLAALAALAALAGLALLSGRGDAGLLAYYSFDTDFTDASGNNNDLTIAAGAPAISATKVNELFTAGEAGDPRITSITSVGPGVWELTLTGASNTDYEFRTSTSEWQG